MENLNLLSNEMTPNFKKYWAPETSKLVAFIELQEIKTITEFTNISLKSNKISYFETESLFKRFNLILLKNCNFQPNLTINNLKILHNPLNITIISHFYALQFLNCLLPNLHLKNLQLSNNTYTPLKH